MAARVSNEWWIVYNITLYLSQPSSELKKLFNTRTHIFRYEVMQILTWSECMTPKHYFSHWHKTIL